MNRRGTYDQPHCVKAGSFGAALVRRGVLFRLGVSCLTRGESLFGYLLRNGVLDVGRVPRVSALLSAGLGRAL